MSNPILRAVVQGVSHYVPERRVSNADLTKVMDTSEQWILERTGIEERRFVDQITPTSHLAIAAAKRVIEKTNTRLQDIDFIIAATLSPDFYFPGIGPMVQQGLGFSTIPALDIRVQCSGLVYGLSAADAFIRSGQSRCLLLVCAEVQSPVLDLSTQGRDTAVLFGDGAGALILNAVESENKGTSRATRGVIDSILGSDGEGADVLCVKAPGTSTKDFITHQDIDQRAFRPHMDGRLVFKNAVTRMCEAASVLLERNNLRAADINLLVPHQANLRINEAVRERLGFREDQVFNNIQKYGNTTSATIPIALSEAEMEGRLKQGDLVLTLAFGAGFTWGANLIVW